MLAGSGSGDGCWFFLCMSCAAHSVGAAGASAYVAVAAGVTCSAGAASAA